MVSGTPGERVRVKPLRVRPSPFRQLREGWHEWFKAPALNTGGRKVREFESLSLRHSNLLGESQLMRALFRCT